MLCDWSVANLPYDYLRMNQPSTLPDICKGMNWRAVKSRSAPVNQSPSPVSIATQDAAFASGELASPYELGSRPYCHINVNLIVESPAHYSVLTIEVRYASSRTNPLIILALKQ